MINTNTAPRFSGVNGVAIGQNALKYVSHVKTECCSECKEPIYWGGRSATDGEEVLFYHANCKPS